MSNTMRSRQPLKDYKEAFDKINKAARARLSAENNLDIGEDIVGYTVALTYLEEVAHYLRNESEATGKPVSLQMDGVLTFGTNTVESETGEKSGNLVPYVTLGELFKLGVKNDASTEE